MSDLDDIRSVLGEICDNQKRSIEMQAEHLAIAQAQLERAKTQVAESLTLQREAVQKQKMLMRIVMPIIVFCIILIVYLILKYF